MYFEKKYRSKSKQDLLEIYVEETINMLCISMTIVFMPLMLLLAYLQYMCF